MSRCQHHCDVYTYIGVGMWIGFFLRLFFGTPVRAFITVVGFIVWNVASTPPPPERIVHPKVQAAKEASSRCHLESFGRQVVSFGWWNKYEECGRLSDRKLEMMLRYPDKIVETNAQTP